MGRRVELGSRNKGERGRRSGEGSWNCRFISVQFADRNFLTESAFMREASRPSRYTTNVACLIKKADLLM